MSMGVVSARAIRPVEELVGEGDDGDDENEVESGDCERMGVEPEKVESGGDVRLVVGLGDPRRPTETEVRDHERTHLPYRNWCRH